MFKGRLGIDSARVPHSERAGLLYLACGALTARDGTLAFLARGSPRRPMRWYLAITRFRFRASQ